MVNGPHSGGPGKDRGSRRLVQLICSKKNFKTSSWSLDSATGIDSITEWAKTCSFINSSWTRSQTNTNWRSRSAMQPTQHRPQVHQMDVPPTRTLIPSAKCSKEKEEARSRMQQQQLTRSKVLSSKRFRSTGKSTCLSPPLFANARLSNERRTLSESVCS